MDVDNCDDTTNLLNDIEPEVSDNINASNFANT
jgi:hypothetical protein